MYVAHLIFGLSKTDMFMDMWESPVTLAGDEM